jgi:hypothetical protein
MGQATVNTTIDLYGKWVRGPRGQPPGQGRRGVPGERHLTASDGI